MADFNEIIQEINSNLPDNNTQAITAEKLRTTLIDLTETIEDVQNDLSNVETQISIDTTFATNQHINDVSIVNDLITGGANNILSAEQGKVIAKSNQGVFEVNGNNMTRVDFIFSLKPNTTYRVDLPVIDYADSNVTNGYPKFGIAYRKNEQIVSPQVVTVNKGQTLNSYYVFITPNYDDFDACQVYFRANVGEKFNFGISEEYYIKKEIQPSSVGALNGAWNQGVFTSSIYRVSFVLLVEDFFGVTIYPKSGYGVAVGKYSGYPSSSTYIGQDSVYSENPINVSFDESVKYIHCNIKKIDNSQISASNIADMILPIIAYDGIEHKFNELETEINEKPGTENMDVLDFAISDNDDNQIVAFYDGHIKTKNFDSKIAAELITKVEYIFGHIKSINETSIPSSLSKLAKIKNGENAVLNLGMVGDSWTQGVGNDTMDRITYVKYLTRLLWEKYGYAGLGWFDFGYSNSDMKCADDTCISLVKSGTINYVTRTSESLGIARSHAIFSSGASYTLTLVDTNRPIDNAVIWFYNNAAFTYQINDGESVQVTAASSGGWQSVIINANITKIKLTATADSTIIFGIDFSYGNKGVKVHKLGNRAATSTDFVEGNAESWEEGISKLSLDILTEALYTNDRWIDNIAPSIVVANIQELFSRFKAVAPYADVVCIAPSDNYESGTHPYTTEQYAFAIFDYCRENGYPFIDLIPLFGTKEQVQNLGLFYDNLHPNFAGSNLIGNYIFDKIFNLF